MTKFEDDIDIILVIKNFGKIADIRFISPKIPLNQQITSPRTSSFNLTISNKNPSLQMMIDLKESLNQNLKKILHLIKYYISKQKL